MKTFLNSIFCITMFIIIISANCKKQPNEYPTYYMDKEFKDYVLFPVGSYWIYYDSLNNIEDSIFLFEQEVKILEAKPNKKNYNNEVLDQKFFSSINDTLMGSGGILAPGAPAEYNLYKINNWNYSFFAPANIGDNTLNSPNLKYISFYDTLNIYGNSYYEVKVFENLKQYNNQPKKFYYSRYIGLIKKELFDGTVWVLKKYFINK